MSSIQRHNVSIPVVLGATATFTANLSCSFVPDEIKVKNLTFMLTGATAGAYTVQIAELGGSNPGGHVLGSIIDPTASFSGITIPVNGFTDGTYTFGVYTMTNTVSTAINGANLNILLEFRRYRIRT